MVKVSCADAVGCKICGMCIYRIFVEHIQHHLADERERERKEAERKEAELIDKLEQEGETYGMHPVG